MKNGEVGGGGNVVVYSKHGCSYDLSDQAKI